MRFSRADRSRLAQWWFTVDHSLLSAILILIGAGLVMSLAASPAVAVKKGLPAYYFVERHFAFGAAGLGLMLMISFLSPSAVRRLSLALLVASVAALATVLYSGAELNGAKRWLSLGGHSLQPSEFAKPAFVVLVAWALAESGRRKDMPALEIAIGAWVLMAALLLAQPDVGQTLLISAVWGALYFLSGQRLIGAAAIAGVGLIGLVASYFTFPHVRFRVDRFLAPTPGDRSQVDRAMQSFAEGGFLGRGPGEGTIKTALPDAHTDFIFAVMAEEYGVLACLGLVFLFAFITFRAFSALRGEPYSANRLAVMGLALLFGLQALINMAVNVGLMPAKGMTLPFVSAGGSSTLAISVTLGMLLALTRRRPGASRLKKPDFVGSVGPLTLEGQNTR